MAPGPMPPLPEYGTLPEMTTLYLQTVELYADSEAKRKILVEAFRELQAEFEDQ